jgi:hypothetical protein
LTVEVGGELKSRAKFSRTPEGRVNTLRFRH